jgi:hypothetical protein
VNFRSSAILLAIALLLIGISEADVSGEWRVNLLRGSKTYTTLTADTRDAAWQKCQELIAQQAPSSTTWTCQTPRYVAQVIARPSPIDCAVSGWSAWTAVGDWSACTDGMRTRTERRTRTITREPAHGGASCPPLTESRTVSESCTIAPASDWQRRATAPGVVLAIDFSQASQVTSGKFANGNNPTLLANVVHVPDGGLDGKGALRINVPRSTGADPGAWRIAFPRFWGSGANTQKFYVQFRTRLSPGRLSCRSGDGFKVANISSYSRSLTAFEVVPWNYWNSGELRAYYAGSPPFKPDPATPFRMPENEWFTVYFEIQAARYSGSHADNTMIMRAARDGAKQWQTLYELRGGNWFGSEGEGFSGIWFTPYSTNRSPNACADGWHEYDELIVSTQPIALPGSELSPAPAEPPAPAPPEPEQPPSAGLPSWLPPKGSIAAISVNTLADVDPCPARNCSYSGHDGQAGVLIAWTGGVYAESLGEYGSILLRGGGHSSYLGTEVYRFDLGTRRFTRITEPVTQIRFDPAEGECAPQVPCADHTYDQQQWIPGEAFGNKHGALVRLISTSNHTEGTGGSSGASGRSHALDLDTMQWSRWSTNKATLYSIEETVTVWDKRRNCAWAFTQGFVAAQRICASDRTWTAQPGGHQYIGNDSTGAYDPVADALIILEADAVNSDRNLLGYDPTNPAGGLIDLRESGSNPGEGGFDYAPWLDAFVAYKGGRDIYVAKRPSNWKTGTWTWTRQTLSGVTPAAPTNGIYSRFRCVRALETCFAITQRTAPVYAIRPN